MNAAPAVLAPPPLTGRMPSVCMYCGDTYGYKPCLPEMDGQASHGVCHAAACQARLDADFPVRFTCRPVR